MVRHFRYECNSPQRFECPHCNLHLRQRTHVWTHIRTFHPDKELFCIDIATQAKLTRHTFKDK